MRKYTQCRINIGKSGTVMYYTFPVFYQHRCRKYRQCRILRTMERKFALDFAAAVYYQLLFIQIITLS